MKKRDITTYLVVSNLKISNVKDVVNRRKIARINVLG